MKNLILIRHAKSSWDMPSTDKERQLCKRGVNDAHRMAEVINEYLPKTFIIWSSTAQRAKSTAYIFTENLAIPSESIIFKDELYTFEVAELEKCIRGCDNIYDSLIIFGHNDAITDFVNTFGNIAVKKIPTAGFVSLQFNANSWKDIAGGKTLKLLFPRDVKQHECNTSKQVY